MQLTQSVPAVLLECVPTGLLHLDGSGRIDIVNPRALDLLGRSVFECLDRDVAEVLGLRPGTARASLPGRAELSAESAQLVPPFAGEIVVIAETAVANADPEARTKDDARLAHLEAVLDRAASAMPLAAPALARLELAGAITELRRYRRREDDLALERVLARGESPPSGEIALAQVVQEVLVTRAAWIRLVGTSIELTKAGPLDAQAHASLARIAIEDLLDFALEAAGPNGALAIRLEGDSDWRCVRVTATAAADSRGARPPRGPAPNGPAPNGLGRAGRITELLGGRLEVPPPGAAPDSAVIAFLATPASATPASATPASATPASATPASATPASATPASATPASRPTTHRPPDPKRDDPNSTDSPQ